MKSGSKCSFFSFNFNKKAAIGLPINVLVIIIISLVILGSGVALLYKFIGGAEELKGQLDERAKEQLERLLVDQGKMVALPLYTVNLFPGEDHVFGIGILNVGGEGISDKFQIIVTPTKLVSESNEIITEQIYLDQMQGWVLYNSEEMVIKENEHSSEPIFVEVPNNARKGQHVFKVDVLNNGQQYGNVQKFYVNVK